MLVPGGRMGLTVWGHIKASPGAWALSAVHAWPAGRRSRTRRRWWRWAVPAPARSCSTRCGFVDVARVEVPFVWEFADPETYARALASTGPAYEAIQTVGEEAFPRVRRRAGASERVRDGLPLRAEIDVVGYPPAPAERPAAQRVDPRDVGASSARRRSDTTPRCRRSTTTTWRTSATS